MRMCGLLRSSGLPARIQKRPRVYHYENPALAVLKTWHNAAIRSGFLDAVAHMHQSLTTHERVSMNAIVRYKPVEKRQWV